MSAAAVVSGAASMPVVAGQLAQYVTAPPAPEVVHCSFAQPTITYLAPPAPMQYVAQQPMQYVDEQGNPVQLHETAPGQYVDELGNPVQILSEEQPVQYVDEYGNPVQLLSAEPPAVQYVDEYGNPVQLVGADGQPLVYEYVPAAPAVYNVTPEQFALLARGGNLTQAEVDALMGGQPAASPLAGEDLPAATAAPAPSGRASKKKAVSSKKRSKGCC